MSQADLEPKKVLLAYSGGLDTSYLAAWLTHAKGYQVTTLTVDCGGLSDADRERLAQRSAYLGAVEHRIVDARDEMFQRVLRFLIAGNVRRGETYPMCVGAERGLQAEILAGVAAIDGFDAVAHGCTGAGNDQVRFESALAVVAEDIDALAPIRDQSISRDEERAWLHDNGFDITSEDSEYSINKGMWGITIGGGNLLSEDLALPEEAWRWTRPSGLPRANGVLVRFEKGVPVALNGEEMEPVELVEALNELAGAAGIGRGYHLGDTVLGSKGRIAYEAPAAEVLLDAHRELEKLVLTEDQRFLKDHLAAVYGRKLHQGQLHEPMMRDAEAFFLSSQERVSGEVNVLFHGAKLLVQGVSSPFSMMAASDAQYGERPASGSHPEGAIWLARTYAEPARLAKRALMAAAKPHVAFPETRGPQTSQVSSGAVSTPPVSAAHEAGTLLNEVPA